jgi:hypothetical protein
VHLVGFIIRIYHDARSSECQILSIIFQRAVFLSIILVEVQYANKILLITFQSMKIRLSGFKTTNVEAF